MGRGNRGRHWRTDARRASPRDAKYRADGGVASTLASTAPGLLYLLCLWGVIWTACLAASLLGRPRQTGWSPGMSRWWS